MSYGQQRDFEDSVLDGSVKVPHESFDALIAMVREGLKAGAPDVSWAIDGVAEGQELPANVEAALRAYFDAPMADADELAAAERRHEAFDPIDPRDMEDDLRERSENISNARDAAYERGQECFDMYGPGRTDPRARDVMAADYYDHAKLRADFCDGWNDAATEEAHA
jgi:hypothetical protein